MTWRKIILYYIIPILFSYESEHANMGERSSVVGWGTMLQAGRSRDRILMRSLDFFQFT
jgi:hypothetical protein